MKNDYGRGRIKAFDEVIYYIEKQIAFIKSKEQEKNTPRQISNGGKIKAYYTILSKVQSKKEKSMKKIEL